jgi:hypothetical protein
MNQARPSPLIFLREVESQEKSEFVCDASVYPWVFKVLSWLATASAVSHRELLPAAHKPTTN